MCTIVVKAFKDISAVPVTHALCAHDQNGIDIEACIQLITAASSMHNISESYASVMPDWLTTVTLTMCEQWAKWMICTY